MKILRLLLVTAFFSLPAFSQTKVLDSLNDKLKHPASDTEKVQLLNAIASEYLENDPAMMMKYTEEALVLAKQKKLQEEEAESWFNMGNANIMLSNYPEALKSFTNSQDIYEGILKDKMQKKAGHLKESNSLASIYGSIGVVWSEQNNYPKALEYYFKALKLYREAKQEDIVARLYNNIGIVYKSLKDYPKAIEYFNKALEVQNRIGDNTSAITITNVGNIYLAEGEDDKAFAEYNKALKILGQHENKRGEGELYNNLGNYYGKTGDTEKAEESYKKALAIFEGTGEKYGASATLAYLGNLYAEKGNRQLALAYLEKSADYGREIGVLEQVRDSEKSLSDLYENAGDYKEALSHFKKYTVAKDSIINAENIKKVVREEMNYEMERKAALQRAQNEKKETLYREENKRKQQEIIFAGVFILLLFGVAFLIYNRLQLKKTLTLQRDLAEYEQKALHLQMNPHFVFNCLGSISSFIVQNGTDSAIKYLSKFSKLMRLTLEYSKESLIPIDKEIEGLQNYLELEQLRFNQMFDFTITKDTDIEDDMAIPPLLLQPFVENAIIHGIVPKKEKGYINIDFKLADDKLICTVTDDGIGFERSRELKEKSVTVHKSMALEITRKRLEVIQAFTSKASHVEINELVNEEGNPVGTRIVLNLPVQYSTL